MITFAVATLGCKVNQCESAGIAEAMTGLNMTPVPFGEEADCYIINTCTVTGRTDYQSRQLIRRALRLNPAAIVLVTGCYAQRIPAEISRIPGVRIVAGNGEKCRLPEILQELAEDGGLQTRVGDIQGEKTFSPLSASTFPEHTRAFLKIQDGCNARCSYCIVPQVRGPSRSLPPAEVLEAAAELTRRGHREVVLTGIHLGAYGRDLVPAADLTMLLRQLTEAGSSERIRLSSLEPREVTDGILSLLLSPGPLCRHLHIPLQSGDDAILAAMNRDYDTAFFRDLVERIHGVSPEIAIGIDVIAGFPGETEASFRRTVRFLEELPVAYLHVFPYSRRPGTPAAAMAAQVPETDKKRRAEELRRIGVGKKQAFAERFIGTPLSVLIEARKDRATGSYLGFSDNYITVACRGPAEANRIVRVLPGAFRSGLLTAEPMPESRAGGEGRR